MSIHDLNLTSALALQLKAEPQGANFPDPTVDYFERFRRIDEHLNDQIHNTVNQAASVNSEQKGSARPKWLTDHGPEHIATVIRRASELTCHPHSALSAYEVYLLLLAIHFHDVGNIFGRDHHERRITEVMNQIDASVIGSNKLEHRMIRDIAMVHGGEIEVGGIPTKDTIGQLKYAATKKPRIPVLARIIQPQPMRDGPPCGLIGFTRNS